MNSSGWIVKEYADRLQKRKLGYTTNMDKLDVFKAECFTIIANELSRCEEEDRKKSRSK